MTKTIGYTLKGHTAAGNLAHTILGWHNGCFFIRRSILMKKPILGYVSGRIVRETDRYALYIMEIGFKQSTFELVMQTYFQLKNKPHE